MRITGGELRGREITAPRSANTRPLTDRGRAGLYNALGDVSDLSMLDAYAGSGAVGLEALSRGAKQVIGIERNRAAADTIRLNCRRLDLTNNYFLYVRPVTNWAHNNTDKHGSFELIFAGPPFDGLDTHELKLLLPYAKSGSMIIIEHYKKMPISHFSEAQLIESRRFGESNLCFYRKR